MNNHKLLALDIINNPSSHLVNRDDKMNATIDKMVENLVDNEIKLNKMSGSSALDNRGYGLKHGRNTGD